MTELTERVNTMLACPQTVEMGCDRFATFWPERFLKAVAAQDRLEVGRIFVDGVLAGMREDAQEAMDEAAEAQDLAEHAEQGEPDLMAMFRGLLPPIAPCAISGDGS